MSLISCSLNPCVHLIFTIVRYIWKWYIYFKDKENEEHTGEATCCTIKTWVLEPSHILSQIDYGVQVYNHCTNNYNITYCPKVKIRFIELCMEQEEVHWAEAESCEARETSWKEWHEKSLPSQPDKAGRGEVRLQEFTLCWNSKMQALSKATCMWGSAKNKFTEGNQKSYQKRPCDNKIADSKKDGYLSVWWKMVRVKLKERRKKRIES